MYVLSAFILFDHTYKARALPDGWMDGSHSFHALIRVGTNQSHDAIRDVDASID